MWKFIVKRLIMLIPVLIGVTLLVFLILQLAPGDPAKVILGEQATPEQIQELRESLGLNDPVLVQYANYIIKLVQGDMGESYKTRGPVSDEVFNRFPNTIKLTACAMLLAVVVAVPLGVVAAVKQNTLFDSISMVIALIAVAISSIVMLLPLFSCTTPVPVNSVSSSGTFIRSAARAQIRFRSVMQAFSTAFPVIYVVLDA